MSTFKIKVVITLSSESIDIWSYSVNAKINMSEVTSSKKWIHFRLFERRPPTFNILCNHKDETYWICLCTFRTTYYIFLPVSNFFKIALSLNNCVGMCIDVENVLLRRKIIWLLNSVNVTKKTKIKNNWHGLICLFFNACGSLKELLAFWYLTNLLFGVISELMLFPPIVAVDDTTILP